MTKRVRRKNESSLGWLRAGALAVATYAALAGMSFAPAWGAILLALVVGALTAAAIDLGVLAALIVIAMPVTAANPLAGIALLTLGIVSIRYLGADGGSVMLIIAAALLGAFTGPAWAAIAIAGYLLGASEGALAAGMAAVAVEVVGLLTGRPSLFGTVTGGSNASLLLDFGGPGQPDSLFATRWIQETFAGFGSETIDNAAAAFGAADQPVLLAVQPLLWALGAVITGVLVRESRRRRNRIIGLGGAALGTVVPFAGALALMPSTGVSMPWASLGAAAASSAIVAVMFIGIAERLFPFEAPVAEPKASRQGSMASEDADVDELLRLISTAEEKLATQHTTEKVVMITDMKAFSRMTEEDGSVVTAKAIQKHRDLLLPLIEKHGGHGKSTGGDGLVAAFESPAGALRAAAEMQRALAAHNSAHPGEREMVVRIGVADGEVVLDKGGRPFIGAALNLAARVMNLADGGQAFATASVANRSAQAERFADLGDFELKNIAQPVSVVEILWAAGQEPVRPTSLEH